MPLMIADKGHTFPLELLESAAKLKPTQWGVSVLMKGELKALQETETLDVKELDKIQKEYKDANFIFTLTKSDKPISEEEQQPFTVLSIETGADKKLKPAIVACVNGEFPTYKGEGNTHANVAREFLSAKLTRMFEKSGKDMAKLMKALEDEDFRELVEAVCKPDGTIALLAGNGQCVYYNVNAAAKKTPFGFTTDLFGLKEESLLPKGKASGLSALSDAASPIEAPEEAPKPEELPATEQHPEGDKADDKKTIVDANAQVGSETHLWVRPKANSGAKAVDQWYYKVCNHLGIKKDTVAMVKNKPAMPVSREFFKNQLHASSDVVAPPKDSQYREFMPESSTAIGDKLKEEQSRVETMPRASDVTIKFIKEQLKLQPGTSNEVLQGLEKKYPSYFQVGHSWDEVKNWPFANYLELAKDPTAVALLAWTLASKVRNIEPRLAASIRETLEQKPAEKQKVAM